jgi:hypothetical protein
MKTTMKYSDATFGLAEAVFNKLGGMEGVKRFLRGDTDVVIKNHTIDCDADPYIPECWKVEAHIKHGLFEWKPNKVMLYLSEQQKDGNYIEGNKLHKELKDKPVLNANVLDYLLANPQLIPEEWKGKVVFFWGTIYRDSDGDLYVRYLIWGGDGWRWLSRWLGDYWRDIRPAAVSASNN